jgi:arylsulfatase A-like enzyme
MSGVGSCTSRPPTAPHVVVILADDLGYADLGFTGCADFPTPALDALAAAGVVFTDGHVSAAVCAPSRAGLITGAHQQRQGFESNLIYNEDATGLALGSATLASRLRAAGYATAGVGKWHLGSAEGQHPLDVGFDQFTGLLKGARSYFPKLKKSPSALTRIERNREIVPESELGYLTDFFSAEAVRFIKNRNPDRPLFLYLSYTAPHTPMHAREDLLERFAESIPDTKRRKYAAMVTALDEGVAAVTETLREEGMFDNTLLIFLSDNGGATTNASDNGPWRGMKGSKWEGGHRVPFLAHWPAGLPSGATYDLPVTSMDITPTALAAAGAEPVPGLDGVDLRPFLLGKSGRPHQRLYWRRNVAAAVRDGDWKLIRIQELDSSYRAPLLFDLAADPAETRDLASKRPEKAAELLELLGAWETSMKTPGWIQGERWLKNQRAKHKMSVVGREAERAVP